MLGIKSTVVILWIQKGFVKLTSTIGQTCIDLLYILHDRTCGILIPSQKERGMIMTAIKILALILYIPLAVLVGLADRYV